MRKPVIPAEVVGADLRRVPGHLHGGHNGDSQELAPPWWRAPLFLLLLACAVTLCSACRTAKGPGADSLASIQVTADEPLAVARAVSKAFQDAGFTPEPQPPDRSRDMRMVFEKEGTTGDTVLFGDWTFKRVWYRAKVRISSMPREAGPRTYLVTCDVFRVYSRGDKHFEEEHRLKSAKRSYYQEILDSAKAQVPPASAPSF